MHQSGLPFDDPSGDRLRSWLAVTRDEFYDERAFAFLPMGLCYPGRATNGADLPPRPECAPLWQLRVIEALPNVQLTLLVGQYALRHHLGNAWPGSVRTAVAAWRSAPTNVWPLPHPSWRVNGWLKQNPWFEREVLPALRTRVRDVVEKQ